MHFHSVHSIYPAGYIRLPARKSYGLLACRTIVHIIEVLVAWVQVERKFDKVRFGTHCGRAWVNIGGLGTVDIQRFAVMLHLGACSRDRQRTLFRVPSSRASPSRSSRADQVTELSCGSKRYYNIASKPGHTAPAGYVAHTKYTLTRIIES